ncbi:mechanosensitive ion channel family protein [Falsihalocynthiibacter sp. BN13B15]|uniref:mechanosensitive ion channel family protein n=1 Tax=Falsihalocynthiibacter sp. BN13B15 TaxID=3240871 RepID=UPI00350ED979
MSIYSSIMEFRKSDTVSRKPPFHWLRLFSLIAIGSFLLALPLHAQTKTTSEETTANVEKVDDVYLAPVVIEGDELFFLRGSSAQPAVERAAIVETRILDVAGSSAIKNLKMDIREDALGHQIFAGVNLISTVTQADSDMEKLPLPVLAGLHADAISEAISNYRADRTDDARADSAIEVGMWTLVFLVFCGAMLLLRKKGNKWISIVVQRQFSSFELATNKMVQVRAIAALILFGFKFILLIMFVLGLYYYLTFVLFAVAETRPMANLLLTHVTGPVLRIALGIASVAPNIVTILLIALLARFLIRGLRVFFDAVAAGSITLGDFEKHWVDPTFNILRVAVILIAIVFCFPYVPGSDSSAFRGLSLLVGAMLSLGSNSVMSNVLSGLFVIYRRSMNIGDRIKVGAHVGDVVEIKLMETHIKSVKNELISIPNAKMLNSEVINYTKRVHGSGLLLHTTVGIGYEETPEKIEAMLIEAAQRTDGLKSRPEPFVLWTELADFAINYQVNAFTTRGSSIPKITSDLHRNIVAVFNENKVQIMTPSYIADPIDPKISAEIWDGKLAHAS